MVRKSSCTNIWAIVRLGPFTGGGYTKEEHWRVPA